MAESATPIKSDTSGVFTPKILNAGFIMALVLAGLCLLLAGWYMITFQRTTGYAVNEVIGKTVQTDAVSKQLTSDTTLVLNAEQNKYKYETLRLSLSVHMYISRILLLSCGILVGLAFGFLGFSLFLVGVKGDVDASLSITDRYKLQLARLSPGLFVILCSAILIVICATRSLPVNFSQKKGDNNSFDINDSKQGHKEDSSGAFDKIDTIIPE